MSARQLTVFKVVHRSLLHQFLILLTLLPLSLRLVRLNNSLCSVRVTFTSVGVAVTLVTLTLSGRAGEDAVSDALLIELVHCVHWHAGIAETKYLFLQVVTCDDKRSLNGSLRRFDRRRCVLLVSTSHCGTVLQHWQLSCHTQCSHQYQHTRNYLLQNSHSK